MPRNTVNFDDLFSIKVDNLSYRTSQDEIRRMFDRYGDIGDIYIPRDRNHQSRGFGFVRYYSRKDAEYAVDRADGKELNGRYLRVTIAKYRRPLDESRDRGRSRSRSRGRRYSRSRSRDRRRSRSRSRQRRHSRSRSRSRDRRRSPSRSASRSRSPIRNGDSRVKDEDRSRSRSRSPTPNSNRSPSHKGSRSPTPAGSERNGNGAGSRSRSRSASLKRSPAED